MSYVASTQAVGTPDVLVPAGSTGDTLVAFTHDCTAAPPGYQLRGVTRLLNGGTYPISVWRKLRDAGDVTGSTQTFTSPIFPVIHLLDLAGDVDVVTGGIDSVLSGFSSIDGPSVDPTAAATLCFFAVAQSTALSGTPTGMTLREDSLAFMQSWTEDVPAGPTGTRSLDPVGAEWVTFMAAFESASVPANPANSQFFAAPSG